MEEAVTAYRAALEERTRDRVPLDWAMTQNNLASVEVALFDKTSEVDILDQAEVHAVQAKEVFEEAGASHYVARVDDIIAKIQSRRP